MICTNKGMVSISLYNVQWQDVLGLFKETKELKEAEVTVSEVSVEVKVNKGAETVLSAVVTVDV